MAPPVEARRATYLGIFFVALATLMFEILLTRIFSARMWYHYAFLAISVAMFGMTVGALLIHLFPERFPADEAKDQMAYSSLCFALSIVVCFILLCLIPLPKQQVHMPFFPLVATYVISTVPFVFSGICVCLALTRFPVHVSRLYAADLIGAGAGCVFLIYVLKVTDAPSAVFVVGLLAAIGSILFASDTDSRYLKRVAPVVGVFLGCLSGGHALLSAAQSPIFRVGTTKSTPIYEKWNSFSRVTVTGDPDREGSPLDAPGGYASPARRKIRQLKLTIDGCAATTLFQFDGDVADLDFLKGNLTNLAHYVRDNAKVLVIGSGGGRDVLSALVFGQKAAVAVELNANIIRAVNRRFGDFTGHLDRYSTITFVNDEARSYIARSRDKHDIIQISLIDTWAATAAGAFVLAENSLYTVEAWKIFLEHLSPRGILTVTRWYLTDRPGETLRTTALAAAALKERGVENPRDHIIVAKNMEQGTEGSLHGKAVVLVSPQPFTPRDIDTVEAVTSDLRFNLVLTPRFALNDNFQTLGSGEGLDEFTRTFPINITPPTDDKPFFFNMLRLRDAFDRELWQQGKVTFNMKAVHILVVLIVTVAVLTFLCILLPLVLKTEWSALRGATPLLLFFAAIGFGFMLIEISQMQRLIILLGHPTYGLSVVLFAMLLSSGLGSYLTRDVGNPGLRRSGITRLLLLLGVLVLFGLSTPHIIRSYEAAATPVRIFMAVGILCPLGLLMGMAFPLGMKVANRKADSLTPWLWGINGATSVSASVFAIAIALGRGISASFWTGFSCYVVAFAAFLWASRGVK